MITGFSKIGSLANRFLASCCLNGLTALKTVRWQFCRHLPLAYDTGPAGTIFGPPLQGSLGYSFFQNQAAPIGVPPLKYHRKFIIPPQAGPLMYAPYGAVVAGISPSANPQSESDFPNGFVYIGERGSISAPPLGTCT